MPATAVGDWSFVDSNEPVRNELEPTNDQLLTSVASYLSWLGIGMARPLFAVQNHVCNGLAFACGSSRTLVLSSQK